MADITLRTVKGEPLTNQEVDDNFSNLNTQLNSLGDLAAIAASKADDPVDIFIYDTSQDSLPGWTHQTSINPPVVQVFSGEAAELNIYDGTDSNLPVWETFTVGANNLVFAAPTALAALNGVVAVATASGLSIIDLASDSATKYTTGADESYAGSVLTAGEGWV
jgi:hypothetical protein